MNHRTTDAAASENGHPGTDALAELVRAAKSWLEDRVPRDHAEKTLLIAIFRAFPEEIDSKENCRCGEQAGCEECLSNAEWHDLMALWEKAAAQQNNSQIT